MRRDFFYQNLPILFVSLLYYILIFFLPFRTVVHIGILSLTIFLFYKLKKDFFTALLYTVILTLPNELGFLGSTTRLTLMEPVELQLGQGVVITTTTLILVSILCMVLIRRSKRFFQYSIRTPDILLFLFFILSLVSFIFFPNINSLYGIISLSEIILLYFILRIFLHPTMAWDISRIVVVSVVFQVLVGLVQAMLRRNIGVPVESVIAAFPYGATAPENEEIFRISGMFGHPNYLAGYLLAFFPYLFIHFRFSIRRIVPILLTISAIIFTQGRTAWVVVLLFLMIIAFHYHSEIRSLIIRQQRISLLSIACILFILAAILFPSIALRIQTVSEAFEEGGSMSVRFKLFHEAINLMTTYPFTGVGLNRSLEFYAYQPITNIFDTITPTSFYKIHNLFLEIGSEVGLPGLVAFILFIGSIVMNAWVKRNESGRHDVITLRQAAVYGIFMWLAIASLNPFFHTSQMKVLILLTAIVMI